jgi:MYXO-CTERM domain-containing protein
MHSRTSPLTSSFSWRASVGAAALLLLCTEGRAHALQWAGRNWEVTNGGMAGVAAGSPNNVSVDDQGFLHLKIVKNGNTWTAAELFTTEKLGFGTYQWQIDAPIDRLDKNVVVGLYPYGPAAGIGQDGTNEIDIEYSFWGNANGVNGDWTDYPASGTVIGEKSYKFSLNGGTLSTSRFSWSTGKIENYLIKGLQPVGSTTDLIESWTYAPQNSKVNIPQQALPLGMNLWCFEAPPSDGKNVEVVIRSFEFVPEGSNPGSVGGAGGTASSGGGGPIAGSGGNGGVFGGAGGAAGSSVGGAGTNAGSAGAFGGGGGSNALGGGGSNTGGGSAGSPSGPGGAPNAAGASSAGAPLSAGADGLYETSNQNAGCTVSDAGNPSGFGALGALALLGILQRARRRRAD